MGCACFTSERRHSLNPIKQAVIAVFRILKIVILNFWIKKSGQAFFSLPAQF